MATVCPQCNHPFEESGGYCPFDGTPLVGQPDPYQRLLGVTLDNRYIIDRFLGEGGMGTVYLGRHTLIEKPVAIKVLKREVATNQNVVTRFMQEARAASSIGHPNIVEFTDFGTTPDGLIYSVMEYVDGPTLKQVLREHAPLTAERVVPIATQIATALAAAHKKGIIHRDLKPENVFVYDRDGRPDFVKIVDFGIAKVTPLDQGDAGPRLTVAGTVFGTPEYMAPEQAAGRSDIDARADVYSLGAIMYRMLTGRVPHKGEDMMRTLAMKMTDAPTSMREVRPDLDIDETLDNLVLRALARKPEQRIQSMDDLASMLRDIAGQDDEQAPTSRPYQHSDSMPTLPYLGQVEDVMAYVEDSLSPSASPASDDDQAPASTRPPAPTRSKRGLLMAVIAASVLVGGVVFGALLLSDNDSGATDGHSNTVVDQRSDIHAPIIDAGAGTDGAALPDSHAPSPPGNTQPKTRTNGDKKTRRAASRRPREHDKKTPTRVRITDPTDVGAPQPRPKRKLEVKVIPQPSNASLYIKQNYSGKGPTTIERPEGTRLAVECRADGHETGRVTVKFDGVTEVYLCVCKRIKKCVDGIKNPFDDCP